MPREIPPRSPEPTDTPRAARCAPEPGPGGAAARPLLVLLALLLLVGGWVCWPTGTLEELTAQPDDEDDPPVEIVLTEAMKLEDFLKAIGKLAEFPLYWDPKAREISGAELIGAQNLRAPREELFSLVRALLTFYELVIVPVGPQGYQIYLVMPARQTAQIVKLKPQYVELDDSNLEYFETQDGLFVTTTIRVENMTNLRDARNALQRIVTGQQIGNVQEVPAARAFVVTDFAPNVVSIFRLLREMDVKPEGRQLKSEYIKLQFATADEIEPVLTDLFTGRERVTAVNQAQGAQPTADIEADPEPRIISDFRTNQLIVYATQDDITEIKEVIRHLDVPVMITNTWVHVQPLKNLDAQETADVLQTLIDQSTFFGAGEGGLRGGGGGDSRRLPRGGAGDGGLPSEQEKPAVVADIASNSLLISASPRQFEELKRIIEEIDTRKPQVLIEAALIELTLDDSYRVAFELGLADDEGIVDDGPSGFGFTSFGLNSFSDNDGDGFFTDRLPNFALGSGSPSGLVGGIFAFGQVPLIFNLLNSVSQSRILQLPSVVTADNEEALIRVLDKQATSTSTSTTGGNVIGGFEGFEEAGVTLQISPHIADNSYLLLNIRMVVSAFVGEPREVAGTLLPADQIEREVLTAVTVPDRHTVVLGGLLGTQDSSSIDQTPLLSDIPLLGELFKSSQRGSRQTSLFLFVTPTIMSEPNGFEILDIESCKRKQKADELIGGTDIYNSYFPACELQDPATGCIRGSGSASDRLDRLGALEATRFSGVSSERLQAERAARRAVLRGGQGDAGRRAPPRVVSPRAGGR